MSILLPLFSHFAKYIFTFSGYRKFDTFSVDIFDTFSVTCQFDTFSVDTLDTFSGPSFNTFNVDLTHSSELTHLAVPQTQQEKSSEVIIHVLEHGNINVSSGRFSVLKIMIKIAHSHGAH